MSIPEEPSEIIPLFPLNVVLFPQSQLHLHVFEERYRILISECITYDSVFGIVLVHEQEVRTIGCTAAVKDVVKRYDDGRMDIIVDGRRRFQLHNFVEAPHPYYSGRVTWLNDHDEEVDDKLRLYAVDLHNKFVSVVFTGIVQLVDVNDIRRTRAFHLVQKSGMDLVHRQAFLAMNSENKRLQFLIQHLETLLPLLSSKKAMAGRKNEQDYMNGSL